MDAHYRKCYLEGKKGTINEETDCNVNVTSLCNKWLLIFWLCSLELLLLNRGRQPV